jgi:hypothetical protein
MRVSDTFSSNKPEVVMATTKAQLHAQIAAKSERIEMLERQLSQKGVQPLPEGATLGKKVRHGFGRAWRFIARCARAVGRAVVRAGRAAMDAVAFVTSMVWDVVEGITVWAARGVKRAALMMYAYMRGLASRVYAWAKPRVQAVYARIKRVAAWTADKVRALASYVIRQVTSLVTWAASFVGEAIALALRVIDGLAVVVGRIIAAIIGPAYVQIRMAMMEAQQEVREQAARAAA